MSSRIDVQQRLSQRQIAEGPHELDFHLLLTQLHGNFLPAPISELEEFVSINVGHEVAERPVRGDDLGAEATLVDLDCFQIKASQSFYGNLRSHGAPLIPPAHLTSSPLDN